MHADLESILWKFGGNTAICLGEEAICAKVYRQTDGQTDRRWTPRHCISSFLEWAKNESVLKLLRTGTLALPFEVGPANNTRGFRSADGPHSQENLRIRVRGYPRPHTSWPSLISVLLNKISTAEPATCNYYDVRIFLVAYKHDDFFQTDIFGVSIRRWGYAKCFFSQSSNPNKLILEHNVLH